MARLCGVSRVAASEDYRARRIPDMDKQIDLDRATLMAVKYSRFNVTHGVGVCNSKIHLPTQH